MLKKAHLRRYGALDRTLNVERVRLALPAVGQDAPLLDRVGKLDWVWLLPVYSF